MNSPLFGGLFDLDNNGRMDPMERGAEIGFIYDVIDDEDKKSYYVYNYGHYISGWTLKFIGTDNEGNAVRNACGRMILLMICQ